jgi:hypothetical protein
MGDGRRGAGSDDWGMGTRLRTRRRSRRIASASIPCVLSRAPDGRRAVSVARAFARSLRRCGIDSGSRRMAFTTVSMMVLLAVYGSWQVFRWGSFSARQPIADAFFYLVTAIAVWTAWSASRRSNRSPRLRRAWRLFAVGLFAQLAGQVAFQVYGLLGRSRIRRSRTRSICASTP